MTIPEYTVNIPGDVVKKSFISALKEKGNFFRNLRLCFKKEIASCFSGQGVDVNFDESLANANLSKNNNIIAKDGVTKVTGYKNDIQVNIDASFCANYGFNDHSLDALNYIDRDYLKLPSLYPFIKIATFFIGNILVLVANGNYRVSINTETGIKIAGYAFDISARKRKSYICLLGVHFDQLFLSSFLDEDFNNCMHPEECLDEVRLDNAFFPATFICQKRRKNTDMLMFQRILAYTKWFNGTRPRNGSQK